MEKEPLHSLITPPSGVRHFNINLIDRSSGHHTIQHAHNHVNGTLYPWSPYYRTWWHLTAIGAIFTAFIAPYQVAFEEDAGWFKQMANLLANVLTGIFTVDIVVNFNLAYWNEEQFVYDKVQIAREYGSFLFWIDVLGIIPFGRVVHFVAEHSDLSSDTILKLNLLYFLRFVRLRRIKKVSEELRDNVCINLLTFTLLRNFAVVVVACHIQSCIMYFLARIRHFDEDTWLGPELYDSETSFERYITALYWSITTFCTVGYGDFSSKNPAEKIAGSAFMIVNIVIAAWIIGSVTLLMLTGDNKTREYRESLEILDQYGSMHKFDPLLMTKLRRQLQLEFNNREIADEQVLRYFPSAVRRKILRRLYKEYLAKSKLMEDVRPQFVDAFLASCTVEIFSAGEEIVERGSTLSDLFLLVGGIAQLKSGLDRSDLTLEAGEFIGEIGFFTESPQIHSVQSVTVCKTLTMPRSTYKILVQDHPGSVGKILSNLLYKVEHMHMLAQLPRPLEELRVGSTLFYTNDSYRSIGYSEDHLEAGSVPVTAVKDLVKMHIDRNHDNETTRLLFAASRGDVQTITLMLDHGFDPNNCDYDRRTALMVASMKGNTDAVKVLLSYGAFPNLTDMHGSSALLEATKNGHDDIISLLSKNGASLSLSQSLAASTLCQAVYDGDILFMKRLLRAGINVNAADYDKRTASHIAAAEGNFAAIRLLAEHGALLSVADRWGNTVQDEARRCNASQLIEFLDGE